MGEAMAMITDIEDFFTRGCGRCERFDTPDCSTRQWEEGLATLRAICLDAGLSEHVKWGHPCYMHAGRNVAIIGAFRGDYRITFFNAALLADPLGILDRQGPNSQTADAIRFTSNEGPAEMRDSIAAYLAEAMAHAEAGHKAEKAPSEVSLPDELVEALDADPEMSEAFHALTPGRQKSYAINLNAAKKPETRIARIEKFRPKILAGKGALER
jgi:uncharacterized protein YdeI (YjbR/CyaY-like superfamily)